jgi:outer membrane protein assembly factor BamB
MVRLFLPLPILLIAAMSLLAADSWPKFRGPTADGHFNRSLPSRWSATENVTWKVSVPGKGWSSPVIVDNQVFVTAAVPVEGAGSDLSLRLLTYDVREGRAVNDVEVFRQNSNDSPSIHTKNSHASPTPVIDGPRIYLHFGHQGTACLERSGNEVWKSRRLTYEPVHGNGGSPIVVGDALIFSCDGGEASYVVGVDKLTGEHLWRRDRDTDATRTFSFSTPSAITSSGQHQVISPGSNTVDALNPATGDLIWRVRYDGYSVIPKPIFGHGLVFVCSGYDRPNLLAIRPDGHGDVTDTHIAWRTDRNVPHTASLLLVGDELYMVSDRGIASCLDAATGRLHWRERLPGGYSASPIYAGDKLYFLNEEGEATVIRRGTKYERVASNSVGERTLASFAAADDRLFIRGEEHLFCIKAP